MLAFSLACALSPWHRLHRCRRSQHSYSQLTELAPVRRVCRGHPAPPPAELTTVLFSSLRLRARAWPPGSPHLPTSTALPPRRSLHAIVRDRLAQPPDTHLHALCSWRAGARSGSNTVLHALCSWRARAPPSLAQFRRHGTW